MLGSIALFAALGSVAETAKTKPEPIATAFFALIVALVTPMFYATLIIIPMRWFRARERVIKITAMIVFFFFMATGVYSAWNYASLMMYGPA
jgi:hypothetical protein